MRINSVCCLLLAGFIISPAMAEIAVTLEAAGPLTAAAYAAIPLQDATVGFGLDVSVTCPDIQFAGFTPGPLFDPVASTPDGDGIAGLVLPPAVVYGPHVLLGTLAFNYVGGPGGGGFVTMGYTPGDLTEGFALPGVGQFASIAFGPGLWCPEPAGLAMLMLGALGLRRR